MEIVTAMSALGSALGFAKSALEARDEAKINAALADINQKHLDLSMAALQLAEKLGSLQSTNAELQREIAELRSAKSERERYVLHEVTAGAFCYRANPGKSGTEPEHYLCQPCYDQGIKSVMRFYETSGMGISELICPSGNGFHNIAF